MINHDRRRELGEFIRARRERLKPRDFGLTDAGRRRTPGLRREEAAQACGLSVTWYTWVEQGREISLSPVALARLARALRLGRAEREYLFALADRRDPDPVTADIDAVPDPVLACVNAITAPAYILDRAWNARGWNQAAEQLLVGWLDQPGPRNLLHFVFLEPAAQSLIADFDDRARRVVAEFRAGLGTHVRDASVRRLIDDLHRNPRFARLWDEHWVMVREGGERRFNHPLRGPVRCEQVSFNLASHPDLKLTILIDTGLPSEGCDRADG